MENIQIRNATLKDLPKLTEFFIDAYGTNTIFKSEEFLKYYFNAINNEPLSNNIIAVNKDNKIVSHYGGLNTNLKIRDKVYQLIWGVSAFTLNEYRGKGINSKIVEKLVNDNQINGVIGFTKSTADFYKKINYNIFDYNRFIRFILILNQEKTLRTSKFINNNVDIITECNVSKYDISQCIEITKENICNYEFDLETDFTIITATSRDVAYLKRRFLNNPFIKYKLYGHYEDSKIKAYIALREENLEPLGYKVTRIIDIYGDQKVIQGLLYQMYSKAKLLDHIYIDFTMIGTIYNKELQGFGFTKLENEGCCILPQVTSPITERPNLEYIGFQSKLNQSDVDKLTINNVYFTRADSDRDRLVNFSQLKKS